MCFTEWKQTLKGWMFFQSFVNVTLLPSTILFVLSAWMGVSRMVKKDVNNIYLFIGFTLKMFLPIHTAKSLVLLLPIYVPKSSFVIGIQSKSAFLSNSLQESLLCCTVSLAFKYIADPGCICKMRQCALWNWKWKILFRSTVGISMSGELRLWSI